MNSNIGVSDDHIIQIIPKPDHTTNQSHEQTPIATSTNSATPIHESRGVNEMTPEELSSLIEDLTRHMWGDEWLESKSIIDKCPDMVRIRLNPFGDTALNVALFRCNFEIVDELIERMRAEDMLIPNSFGNTALHLAVLSGRLEIVNKLVRRPEDMLIQNHMGETALHAAVRSGSLEIVEEFVKRMRPEDMLIPNSSGNTALHLAVERDSLGIVIESVKTDLHVARERGRLEIVNKLVRGMGPKAMLNKNHRGDTALHAAVRDGSLNIIFALAVQMRPEDMLIRNSDGMLPVHLAALYGRPKEMVNILSSQEVLDKMHFKDIKRLFMMTIRFDMFDLAWRLFEKRPTALAIARNEEDVTAVKMLEEKPSGMSDGRLYTKVLTQVETLERKREDAIKSGYVEAVKMLIDNNPGLVPYRDRRNGWNLLHLVVLCRQKEIFESIPWRLKEQSVQAVDYGGNNILHLVARLPQGEFEELSSLRASIQMQRDITWFKFVESNVPPELRTMRNKAGMRPIDIFSEEHKKLSEEIKDAAKGIAESGMLVSTLVATVAFAAALTVPGDKTNAWFTVFILTNAVALFTSSASLLSFLSNFTSSRFARSQFVKSLHPSLTIGRWLLIISVAAMVVAFTAASFLIFHHTSKWVSYAVASMGVFPILLFLLFHFSFLDELWWSRCYRFEKTGLTYYRVTDIGITSRHCIIICLWNN